MEEPSYDTLHRILSSRDETKFVETIEFFPEEGKYHADGHRACGFWCEPKETKRLKGVCPKCGKPLTVGVLHRVDVLADREPHSPRPKGAVAYRSIVPLEEIVGQVLDVGPTSKKVKAEVSRLVADGRTEFGVLLDETLETIARISRPEMAEAIRRMREGRVTLRPGYDGEYGVVSVIDIPKDGVEQKKLF